MTDTIVVEQPQILTVTIDDQEVVVQDNTQVHIVTQGMQGVPGAGIPTGGATGQMLAKNSASDYDTVWANVVNSIFGRSGTVSAQSGDYTIGQIGGITSGSVVFGSSGGTLSQDNANLYYDATNHRINVGQSAGYNAKIAVKVETAAEKGVVVKEPNLPTASAFEVQDKDGNPVTYIVANGSNSEYSLYVGKPSARLISGIAEAVQSTFGVSGQQAVGYVLSTGGAFFPGILLTGQDNGAPPTNGQLIGIIGPIANDSTTTVAVQFSNAFFAAGTWSSTSNPFDYWLVTTPVGSTSGIPFIIGTSAGVTQINPFNNALGDMKVSGATDSVLLYTDASADSVQVGASVTADAAKFYVNGKFSCAGEAEINGNINHDGSNVGFYGTNPVAKPSITGSRGGNAALASLLAGLASMGLITDNTTT